MNNRTIEFIAEGFTLSWDEEGLTIEVNDYHIESVRLSWEQLLSIADSLGLLNQSNDHEAAPETAPESRLF